MPTGPWTSYPNWLPRRGRHTCQAWGPADDSPYVNVPTPLPGLPRSRVSSVLAYLNRVRAMLSLRELGALPFPEPREPSTAAAGFRVRPCVVENVLGLEAGESDYKPWADESRCVIRAETALAPEVIGSATGMPWRAEPPEVVLPVPVVCVSGST